MNAPITVLLIEDNPGDARLIAESLRESTDQFIVHHATRLADGLAAASDADVVLLDLSLPDASGLDTFRAANAAVPDLPIVVLTGLDDETTAVGAVNAGAQDYLVKGRADAEVLRRSIRYAIERQRLVTELRHLDALKTQFIADAAHELRTPLTTLAGFAQLLGKHGATMRPDQIAESVGAIERQSDHIAKLISNLLDLSQIDAGKLRVTLCEVDLARAAQRALDIAGTPPGRRVTVKTLEGAVAMADPIRLDQVLVNLLTNAYRYGGENISISSHRENGSAMVTVADDGEGVPPELIPSLFDPFARGSNASQIKGSGLGLAIVKKLMEAMGGRISYAVGPDSGASFRVELSVPS